MHRQRAFYYGAYTAAYTTDGTAVIGDSIQCKAAGRRLLQSTNQVNQSCLASTILSYKPINRTFRNMYSQIFQCLERFVRFLQSIKL